MYCTKIIIYRMTITIEQYSCIKYMRNCTRENIPEG